MGLRGDKENRKMEEAYLRLIKLMLRQSKDEVIRYCAFLETELARVQKKVEGMSEPLSFYQQYYFNEKKIKQEKRKKRSYAASSPRKKNEKYNARELWLAWQKKPDTYSNKARFITNVIEQCAVDKLEDKPVDQKTAQAWFDDFRIGKTSTEWEAMHGSKYARESSQMRIEKRRDLPQ